MKKILCLIAIWVCAVFQLSAQNIDPDYWDERIYLKLNPEAKMSLPVFEKGVLQGEVKGNEEAELIDMIKRYNPVSLKHASNLTTPDLRNIYEVQIEDGNRVGEILRELGQIPYIQYAERVPIYRTLEYTPNDFSIFNDLYHLDLLQAEEAWEISQGSEEVVIAIVDDAVMVDHEDLQGNIWVNPGEIPGNGLDDDRNGYIDDVNGYDVATNTPNPGGLSLLLTHGTRVAGCAAASTDNGRGVASMGFNCKIMGVKATTDPTSANNRIVTDPFKGVEYAIEAGADVVNMSYGGFGRSQAFQDLFDEGHRRGIVFVAAAGNDGEDVEQFPASYIHVISVAATDQGDRKAGFSNYHSSVDVSAPGLNIRTTLPNSGRNGYTRTSGTSFASPIVAGLLGLMKSVNPCATPDELEEILKNSSDNINGINPSLSGKLGAGRVNAAKALAAVSAPNQPTADFEFDGTAECSNRIIFRVVQDSEEDCAAANRFAWEVSGEEGFSTTSREQNPAIAFPGSGTYQVRLRVSNSAGTAEISRAVEVEINPNAFIEAGKDTVLCLGEAIQLNANTTANPVSISWSPLLGLSDTAALNPTFTASRGGGTYNLTIVGEDGCVLEDSLQIDVFRPPFILVSPEDTTINPGDTIILQARGAIYYEWSPASSLSDSTISTPQAFPTTTTTYTIRAEGAGRCEGETTYTINVSESTPSRPLIIGQHFIDPIYPNPATDVLSLEAEFHQTTQLNLSLLDSQGRIVSNILKAESVSGRFSRRWNIPQNLGNGVYWLMWEIDGLRKGQRILIIR